MTHDQDKTMVKSALMEAWEAGCAACEQGVDFSGNPHNPPGALDDDSGIEFDAWLAGWADVKKQMA